MPSPPRDGIVCRTGAGPGPSAAILLSEILARISGRLSNRRAPESRRLGAVGDLGRESAHVRIGQGSRIAARVESDCLGSFSTTSDEHTGLLWPPYVLAD